MVPPIWNNRSPKEQGGLGTITRRGAGTGLLPAFAEFPAIGPFVPWLLAARGPNAAHADRNRPPLLDEPTTVGPTPSIPRNPPPPSPHSGRATSPQHRGSCGCSAQNTRPPHKPPAPTCFARRGSSNSRRQTQSPPAPNTRTTRPTYPTTKRVLAQASGGRQPPGSGDSKNTLSKQCDQGADAPRSPAAKTAGAAENRVVQPAGRLLQIVPDAGGPGSTAGPESLAGGIDRFPRHKLLQDAACCRR